MLSSVGSFCEIIKSLGFIILGGVTVAGTIGGGTVIDTLISVIVGTSLGTTLVWVFYSSIVLNNFVNILMACNWISMIMKGVYGPGFLRNCNSSLAVLVDCSVENNPCMISYCGNNYNKCSCLSPLVLGV